MHTDDVVLALFALLAVVCIIRILLFGADWWD